VLYHYGSAADGETLAQRGYRVAKPGERIILGEALSPRFLAEPA
jgi:hypothetical protein